MIKIQRNFIASFFIISYLFTCCYAIAATTSNNQGNVNTQEVKEEYRAFLQQLKQLNSQYKQVTGQIAQVMKEEGTPSWDAGNADKTVAELFPKQDSTITPEPAVTIKETQQDLTVAVDLPGIKKDSLKIAVQDGKKLVITASRKTETEAKKVEKSVDLPSAVDPKGAKASYEDGVLTIKLLKTGTQEVVIPVR